VSPGTVSRYLGGSRGARLDGRGARTIERIASALGVEADYFREYRAWRIREIVVASPALMDDFYDLIVETARLRGFLKDGADDADQ
jgi:transcriptional regulator with XRE-family HTH domain